MASEMHVIFARQFGIIIRKIATRILWEMNVTTAPTLQIMIRRIWILMVSETSVTIAQFPIVIRTIPIVTVLVMHVTTAPIPSIPINSMEIATVLVLPATIASPFITLI